MPAIVDTGAQFSCIRVDVIEYLHLSGHPASVFPWDVNCLLADGTKGHVANAVKLHFGLLSFSWTQEFKILQNGPFPAILGLDFLQRSQMTLDIPSKSFRFNFAPGVVGAFNIDIDCNQEDPFLKELCVSAAELTSIAQVRPQDCGRRH